MKSMTRRNFLTVAGAIAGTTALAGCNSGDAEKSEQPADDAADSADDADDAADTADDSGLGLAS